MESHSTHVQPIEILYGVDTPVTQDQTEVIKLR
jgi:hypothetical protein